MGLAGSLMVLIIAWWIALFMLLPIGVRTQSEEGQVEPGTDPSAPVNLDLRRKALWALVIAFVFWAALFWFIHSGFASFEGLLKFYSR